ncbi:MAG: ketoacyl-ACP synthase III [Deferribacteres bacterium]|nr:ketoacyl-ACP synthase III [candidate division KSB1 bacterium]MCB9503479.1 ketoacyl-ACP synthase III [Deferribacteres bacterium]
MYLHGIGHFHPENVIDNKFLEDLDIGTNNEWIIERVGIETRRTVLPLDYIRETHNQDMRAAYEASLYTNAKSGALAAEKAIAAAGISKEDIGLVIAGGCTPEYETPAESATIAGELGLEKPCYDINSACSTFGAHIYNLSMMRPEALPEYILLVIVENSTRSVDYSDRSAAVLWGDASMAAVVSTRVPGPAQIDFSTLTSSPAGWDKVVVHRMHHFTQEGKTVQTFAIKRTIRLYREIEEKFGASHDKLYFISHQANLRMLESVCSRCNIPDDLHLYNVDKFGNTGATGAPTVLNQNWSKFKPGDAVALIVVGAGLSWSSMFVEFNELKK